MTGPAGDTVSLPGRFCLFYSDYVQSFHTSGQ